MRLTRGILRLTLSDEAASAVNTRRMELHELKILQGQASTRNHRVTDWFAVGLGPCQSRTMLPVFFCLPGGRIYE